MICVVCGRFTGNVYLGQPFCKQCHKEYRNMRFDGKNKSFRQTN